MVCKSIEHNASIIGRFSEEIMSFLTFLRKLGHVLILTFVMATTSHVDESQAPGSSSQVSTSSLQCPY